MKTRTTGLLLAFAFMAPCAGNFAPARAASQNPTAPTNGVSQPTVIHVVLTRQENVPADVGMSANFDPAVVDAAVAKMQVRLPSPLPAGAKVGVLNRDDVFMIRTPAPDGAGIVLTVDANMNRDLTDDAPVAVSERGKGADAPTVRIKRSYKGVSPSEVWLPYSVHYSTRKNAKGQVEDNVGFYPTYRMEGSFTVDGKEYGLELSDFNARGMFNKSNLSAGTVIRLYPRDDPKNGARLYGHELLPVGDRLYELTDEALNGAWVDLTLSTLPQAMIGRPLPDFDLIDSSGSRVRKASYNGRYLLLDFWPSWCGPCVKEFDNIKAAVVKYSARPLSVVSVNLDSESMLDGARKIIADKQVSWPQVLPGKGYFLPLYQVLGRLPEEPGAFPLYVIAGPDGIVRYATNSFLNMQRCLDVLLGEQPADDIFVPMVGRNYIIGAPHVIDFDSEQARAGRARGTLPADVSAGSRVGRLPNGMLVLVQPGTTPEKLRLRVAGTGELDLTKAVDKDIRVLDAAPSDVKGATSFNPTVSYASGAQTFLPFYFFALKRAGGEPEVFYWGYGRPATGAFVVGDAEYRLEISDSSADLHYSDDDVRADGFLTLKQKKGQDWVPVQKGSAGIPVAGRLYRVRAVDDRGTMVELAVR